MIVDLHLENIGPLKKLEAPSFGERLNLVTGDNGLGKTFFLDACWFALTRYWPQGRAFHPNPQNGSDVSDPAIRFTVSGKTASNVSRKATFDFNEWKWLHETKTPAMPGLVIYARVDGGFSIWDPVRKKDMGSIDLTESEVWNGQADDEGFFSSRHITNCNGLIRDLETWRLKENLPFKYLKEILEVLSPGSEEKLSIGESVRISPNDTRDIPTLELPYGKVPVTSAASGIKRVLALAYILVWAWHEHSLASGQKRETPGNRIVLLVDEIEAHLHPRWQRVILPALFSSVETMITGEMKNLPKALKSIQIITTTHSPLIPSSVETLWDDEKDSLFDFDLSKNGVVEFRKRQFSRRGSVEHWLTSELFDLESGYSKDAENAINEALDLMQKHEFGADAPDSEKERVNSLLKDALGDDDEFWPRWVPWQQDEMAGQTS